MWVFCVGLDDLTLDRTNNNNKILITIIMKTLITDDGTAINKQDDLLKDTANFYKTYDKNS